MDEARKSRERRQGGRRATDLAPDAFCVDTRAQLARLLVNVQRLTDVVQVLIAERHKPAHFPDSEVSAGSDEPQLTTSNKLSP